MYTEVHAWNVRTGLLYSNHRATVRRAKQIVHHRSGTPLKTGGGWHVPAVIGLRFFPGWFSKGAKSMPEEPVIVPPPFGLWF